MCVLSCSEREEPGHNTRPKQKQTSTVERVQCLTSGSHSWSSGFQRAWVVSPSSLAPYPALTAWPISSVQLHSTSANALDGHPSPSITNMLSNWTEAALPPKTSQVPLWRSFMSPKPVTYKRILYITKFRSQLEIHTVLAFNHSFCVLILEKYFQEDFIISYYSLIFSHNSSTLATTPSWLSKASFMWMTRV